jgi:hypothetical protein
MSYLKRVGLEDIYYIRLMISSAIKRLKLPGSVETLASESI